MRILLVSDTHGNQPALLKAHASAGLVDIIIHLGDGEADGELLSAVADCPVLQIAGNCDLGSNAPRELVCEWNRVRFLLCHGDRYGVKTGFSRLIERGTEAGTEVVLYGHTHLAHAEVHDGIWLINPGTMNRQALFHSYAVLELGKTENFRQLYTLCQLMTSRDAAPHAPYAQPFQASCAAARLPESRSDRKARNTT